MVGLSGSSTEETSTLGGHAKDGLEDRKTTIKDYYRRVVYRWRCAGLAMSPHVESMARANGVAGRWEFPKGRAPYQESPDSSVVTGKFSPQEQTQHSRPKIHVATHRGLSSGSKHVCPQAWHLPPALQPFFSSLKWQLPSRTGSALGADDAVEADTQLPEATCLALPSASQCFPVLLPENISFERNNSFHLQVLDNDRIRLGVVSSYLRSLVACGTTFVFVLSAGVSRSSGLRPTFLTKYRFRPSLP